MLLTLRIAPLIQGREKKQKKNNIKQKNSLFNKVAGNKTNDKHKLLNCIIGPHKVDVCAGSQCGDCVWKGLCGKAR